MDLFGKNKTVTVVDNKRVEELEREISDLKHSHQLEIEKLEHTQVLAIKDLEFNMKNFKDTEILSKNEEIIELTNKNAVLTKENEMMNKMVDINADIVDVKDIINKLIEKMPEIKLTTLAGSAPVKQKES